MIFEEKLVEISFPSTTNHKVWRRKWRFCSGTESTCFLAQAFLALGIVRVMLAGEKEMERTQTQHVLYSKLCIF